MRNAKRMAAVVFGAGLVLLGLAAPASAQSAGPQRFIVFGTFVNGVESSRVIAIGPFTSIGTFEETANEDVVRFVFPEGTLTLDAPTEEEDETFDETSCSGSFTFSGPWEVIGATRSLAGTTGSGEFSGRGRFVGVRTPTGCLEDEDAGFSFFIVDVTGDLAVPGSAAA